MAFGSNVVPRNVFQPVQNDYTAKRRAMITTMLAHMQFITDEERAKVLASIGQEESQSLPDEGLS